jgi:hypothetical protein
MTEYTRGVTKGVHYIAFLAGAHPNHNFNFEEDIQSLKGVIGLYTSNL